MGLDALSVVSKKVVHKAAEAIGKFMQKVTNWQNCKTKICNSWKSSKCWRNKYSAREKRKNIKWIMKSIIKMEHLNI